MKCPWLINTVMETNNRNSYNDSRRTEYQTFATCIEKECPFYHEKLKCTRVLENKPLT